MERVRRSAAVQDNSCCISYNPEVNTVAIKYGRSTEVFAKIRLEQLLKKEHKVFNIQKEACLSSRRSRFWGLSGRYLYL